MHSNRQNEIGFSLIEILVVVVIIGILAALLLSAILSAKAHAKSVACKSNLHQMGIALEMYVHENQNKYPYYLGPPGPSYGDAIGQHGRATGLIYWSSKLRVYGLLAWTNRDFHCPGYKAEIAAPWMKDSPDRHGSYAYNTYGVRTDNTTRGVFGLGPIQYWETASRARMPAVSESQVLAPSQMLAIGDSLMKVGMRGGSDGWRCVTPLGSPILEASYVTRHGSKDNQLYVDGHVSTKAPRELYDPEKSARLWNYDHNPHEELWKK